MEDGISDVAGMKGIIDRAKKASQAEVATDKRHTRNCRESCREVFLETPSPIWASVGKVAGDLLFNTLTDEKALPYLHTHQLPEMSPDVLTWPDCFQHPRLVRKLDELDGEATFWHTECARVIDEISSAAPAKRVECLDNMRKSQLKGVWGCLEPTTPLKYNAFVSSESPFEAAEGLKCPAKSQLVGTCQASMEANPYRLHAHFHHQLDGHVIIVPIIPELMIQYPRIEAFLADSSILALKKCAAYLLGPGQSLWIPYGFMPLVIGVPPSCITSTVDANKKLDKAEWQGEQGASVQYAISACYNKLWVGKNVDIDLQAAGLWPQARQYFFRNFKINAAVKAWAESLAPAVAVEEDEAAKASEAASNDK